MWVRMTTVMPAVMRASRATVSAQSQPAPTGGAGEENGTRRTQMMTRPAAPSHIYSSGGGPAVSDNDSCFTQNDRR